MLMKHEKAIIYSQQQQEKGEKIGFLAKFSIFFRIQMNTKKQNKKIYFCWSILVNPNIYIGWLYLRSLTFIFF